MAGDLIVEVVPSVPLKTLATAPPQVIGLLNYGNIPIPVVDFKMLMEGELCREALHTRIIILQKDFDGKSLLIGVRAEKVTEVFESELKAFEDKGVASERWPFANGVLTDSKGLMQFIDTNKFIEWYCQTLKEKADQAMEQE